MANHYEKRPFDAQGAEGAGGPGTPMMVLIDNKGTLQGFERSLQEALNAGNPRSLLVFACDANGFEARSLDPILAQVPVPIFGGIFPAIVHENAMLEKGTIVIPLEVPTHCLHIPQLSDSAIDHIDLVDQQIAGAPEMQSMLIFVDGFAKHIDALINALFTVFGLAYNYIGGGAGSLSMESKPCVITNGGLMADAAVIALLDTPSSVGVSHGWTSIAGPYRITESEGNLIRSIDWQPAFAFYRDFLTRYGQVRVTRENFFHFAKAFPLGIAKLDAEPVVRDPCMVTPEGHLLCVGDLPEGSFVNILQGNARSLIQAAKTARESCEADLTSSLNEPLGVFIDCISRALFLGDRFSEELDAVFTPGRPMVGACTCGEIANTGGNYIEFYNKTAVVGCLGGA